VANLPDWNVTEKIQLLLIAATALAGLGEAGTARKHATEALRLAEAKHHVVAVAEATQLLTHLRDASEATA
jgi:hypothetical protein